MFASPTATHNIDDEGQSMRIRRGVIAVSGTILLTVVLISLQVPILYRCLLIIPFLGSLNLVYQGLFKT